MVEVGLISVLGPSPPKSTNVQGAESQDEGGVKVVVKAGNEVTSGYADILHYSNIYKISISFYELWGLRKYIREV
jgi:hypothetical protein